MRMPRMSAKTRTIDKYNIMKVIDQQIQKDIISVSELTAKHTIIGISTIRNPFILSFIKDNWNFVTLDKDSGCTSNYGYSSMQEAVRDKIRVNWHIEAFTSWKEALTWATENAK